MAGLDVGAATGFIEPRLKVLRHPGVIEKLRAGKPVWPVNVEIDLSDACNLKCRWCAFAGLRSPTRMACKLAWRILRELAIGGTTAITFSGGGEPTTNPDFARLAWGAQSLGFNLGVYTNAVEIGGLLECLSAFKWVYVSLDEIEPEAYQQAKGRDCLPLVMRNVRKLAAAKDGTVLGIGFLVHERNVNQLNEMAGLANGLWADYVQFRPVVGLDDYGWVLDNLDALGDVRAEWGDYAIVATERFVELWRQQHGEWERGYEICRGSQLVPCVGADGTLWVCPNTRGIRPLGNLAEESFADIWKRRPTQYVDEKCRIACRNHNLNRTLEYVCGRGPHNSFV